MQKLYFNKNHEVLVDDANTMIKGTSSVKKIQVPKNKCARGYEYIVTNIHYFDEDNSRPQKIIGVGYHVTPSNMGNLQNGKIYNHQIPVGTLDELYKTHKEVVGKIITQNDIIDEPTGETLIGF